MYLCIALLSSNVRFVRWFWRSLLACRSERVKLANFAFWIWGSLRDRTWTEKTLVMIVNVAFLCKHMLFQTRRVLLRTTAEFLLDHLINLGHNFFVSLSKCRNFERRIWIEARFWGGRKKLRSPPILNHAVKATKRSRLCILMHHTRLILLQLLPLTLLGLLWTQIECGHFTKGFSSMKRMHWQLVLIMIWE